jgi:hypothetical protein
VYDSFSAWMYVYVHSLEYVVHRLPMNAVLAPT